MGSHSCIILLICTLLVCQAGRLALKIALSLIMSKPSWSTCISRSSNPSLAWSCALGTTPVLCPIQSTLCWSSAIFLTPGTGCPTPDLLGPILVPWRLCYSGCQFIARHVDQGFSRSCPLTAWPLRLSLLPLVQTKHYIHLCACLDWAFAVTAVIHTFALAAALQVFILGVIS